MQIVSDASLKIWESNLKDRRADHYIKQVSSNHQQIPEAERVHVSEKGKRWLGALRHMSGNRFKYLSQIPQNQQALNEK